MNIPDEVLQRLEALIPTSAVSDHDTLETARDLLLFHSYGQTVFSQNGLGLRGYSFRQRNGNTVMSIKVEEGGIPLVAFVTSHTPTGCIEQLWDLFEGDRLKWQRDKYPVV